MENEKIKNILFVCTGNSCRSIMAEGLLKKALAEEKIFDIEINSCGMAATSGFSPTVNTIQVMKTKGIDVSEFKSSSLTEELIDKADLILVMNKMHKEEIIRLAPRALGKVHLLRKYVKKEGEENDDFSVLDPIGKPLEVYERVLVMIKEAVERLTEKLK